MGIVAARSPNYIIPVHIGEYLKLPVCLLLNKITVCLSGTETWSCVVVFLYYNICAKCEREKASYKNGIAKKYRYYHASSLSMGGNQIKNRTENKGIYTVQPFSIILGR
jgi:hypothetical protein